MCDIEPTQSLNRHTNGLVVPRMQPSSGGFLMKPDIGAIADVLSDVLDLIEMLRGDVLQMMEDLEE